MPLFLDFPSFRNAPGSLLPPGLMPPGQSMDDTGAGIDLTPSEYTKRLHEHVKQSEAYQKAEGALKKAEKKREDARKKRMDALAALGEIIPPQMQEAQGLSSKEGLIAGGLSLLGRLFGGERAMPGIQSGLRSYVQGVIGKRKEAADMANKNAMMRSQAIKDNAELQARLAEIPYSEAEGDLAYARKSFESTADDERAAALKREEIAQRREAATQKYDYLEKINPNLAIESIVKDYNDGVFGPPNSQEAITQYMMHVAAYKSRGVSGAILDKATADQRDAMTPVLVDRQKTLKALDKARTKTEEARLATEKTKPALNEARTKQARAAAAKSIQGGGRGSGSGGSAGKGASTGKPMSMNQITQRRIALEKYVEAANLERAELEGRISKFEWAQWPEQFKRKKELEDGIANARKELGNLAGKIMGKAPAP